MNHPTNFRSIEAPPPAAPAPPSNSATAAAGGGGGSGTLPRSVSPDEMELRVELLQQRLTAERAAKTKLEIELADKNDELASTALKLEAMTVSKENHRKLVS